MESKYYTFNQGNVVINFENLNPEEIAEAYDEILEVAGKRGLKLRLGSVAMQEVELQYEEPVLVLPYGLRVGD